MSSESKTRSTHGRNKENNSSSGKPPPLSKTRPVSKENRPIKRARPVEGVPQRKLILKPVNKKQDGVSGSFVKPSPFVAKATVYDDHWLKKQERGFTKWLNFVLAPTDEFGNPLSTIGKTVPKGQMLDFEDPSSIQSNSIQAPLQLLSKRRLLRWRQSLYCVYQSEPYTHVISRVEIEIETGRILMHRDKRPHCDVGAREKLLEMLMSYNPVWLRLGLEAVFGELIEPSPHHSLPQLLSVYIHSRFLSNEGINERYAHPTLMGKYGEGYQEAQCQHIVKKFLQLVLLLDKAKLTHLIDHDPCLFEREASIKSSRNMLFSFSSSFLSGEGDLTRHLHHMGYSVTHSQSPLDEFDYSVQNLATDLQDGLRLMRLVEMCTGNWKISDQLRVPATTKMQKLHNVELVLTALGECVSIPGGITASNIVEGHRERTLNLLWTIIFHFKVKLNIDVVALQREIAILSRTKPHSTVSTINQQQLEPDLFFQSAELSLLLQWCKQVGSIYGIQVNNFNSSFSDGRLLCHLLHHYQPRLLPLELINNETTFTTATPTLTEPVKEDVNGGWSASFSPTTGRDKGKEKLLANEKSNYKLLYQKLRLLAGVPLILLSKDMSGTLPDEKVVITVLSYLCHQLLLLKTESDAALVIQRAWRRMVERQRATDALLQETVCRDTSARSIQAVFRSYMQRKRYLHVKKSVCVIQQWWRNVSVARRIRLDYVKQRQAAIILQSYVRRRNVQLLIKSMDRAATRIQASFKGHLQRKRYLTILQSVTVVQTRWRATLCARECRRSYLTHRRAIVTIQSHYRRVMVQRALAKQHKAATTIQAAFKCRLQRRAFVSIQHSVRIIQMHWRATLHTRQCSHDYRNMKQAIVCLQSHVRRRQVQKRIALQRRSATIIQAAYRGYLQKQRYLTIKQSVTTIELYWQARLLARKERTLYIRQRNATIVLQSHTRKWQVQKNNALQNKSATKIQSVYRMYRQKTSYLKMRDSSRVISYYWRATLLARQYRADYLTKRTAIITCQSIFRGNKTRRMISAWHSSATKLQSLYRCHTQRTKYQQLKNATRILQLRWRFIITGRKFREGYLQQKRAVTILQAYVRRWQVQKMLAHEHKSATIIQASVRGYLQRRQYLLLKHCVGIVERYRQANLECRRYRESYLEMKYAAITIQSHMRRRQVQKKIAKQHKAATTIQAAFKCHSQRRAFVSIQHSVRIIQMYWRAILHTRQCRHDYMSMRQAIVCLQSHVRRRQVQKRIANEHKAATTIQSQYRCHLQRKRFSCVKQSVIVIQCHWRNTLLTRRVRNEYIRYCRAVVVLQSHVRRRNVQKMIAHWNDSAAKVQSVYRMYLQRKQYQRMKQSVAVIEKYWKTTLLSRNQRSVYLKQRQAVVVLQSHVRRRNVQKMIAHWNDSAAKVQSVYRMYQQRKQYQRMKQSVAVIEKYWKATLLTRNQRSVYLKQRQAVVVLQSHVRRWQVQREIALENKAAIVIQLTYRCHLQKTKYSKTKASVSTLQLYWRSTLLSRQCRNTFLQQKKAAILIQACLRRRNVQRMIANQHKAATTIQTVYRGYVQRGHYLEMKRSVRVIEKHRKAILMSRQCRAEYLKIKDAAITLQSHWRRIRVQKVITCQHNAATVIQSLYKGHLQKGRYYSLKRSAIVLQYYWRATLQARHLRTDYLKYKRAVVIVQLHARRRAVERMMACRQHAATLIQASFRRYYQRKAYLKIKHSAAVIGCYWRATRLGKQCRDSYVCQQQAVITIQSHYRKWVVQKRLHSQCQAAIAIQASFRQYTQRKKYLALKQSVCIIERYWSATVIARRQRTAYLKQRKAIITLQAQVRCRRVQRMLSMWHSCAIKIQSQYRCHVQKKRYLAIKRSVSIIQYHFKATLLARQCRRDYLTQRQATIICQSHFRRRQVQNMINSWHASATMIQAVYRCYSQQKKYAKLRNAACVIQAHWRAVSIAKLQRREYLRLRETTVRLQSIARRIQVEKALAKQHQAAIVIQAMFRKYIAQKNYNHLKGSVTIIYNRWRATLLARKCRNTYLIQKKAVVIIQSNYRRVKVQRTMATYHAAATTIEALYRGYIQRKKYTMLKQSVHTIQYYWRATLIAREQRRLYLKERSAIITLQSCWRKCLVLRQFNRLVRASTIFQSRYRGMVARRRYLRLRGVVITIQRSLRVKAEVRRLREAKRMEERNRGALVIQKYWRKYQEAYYQERKIKRCATMIQSLWRGYRVRRRIKDKALVRVCKRVMAANKAARENNKLMNRLPSMLDTLLQAQYLSTVGDVLKSFELITSVSERCSGIIVEGNALPVLFHFMRTSNRSRPTLEVMKTCLQILNNVAKWRSTQHSVLAGSDCIECLLDFMQKVYVTHPDIMLLGITLLVSYKQVHPHKNFPETCHRKLKSMKAILTRKMKMQTKPNTQYQLCVQYLNDVIGR